MKVVIIGGGIAGVCCAEELTRLMKSPSDGVVLICASSAVKSVGNVQNVTQRIEQFDVVERSATSLTSSRLHVIQGVVSAVFIPPKEVVLEGGERIAFDALCICTGARPKELHSSRHVLTLRDRYSVQRLQERLSTAQRVMVVGNGGIALDLMSHPAVEVIILGCCRSELQGYELIWVLKHGHIGEAFFDSDTAQFLIQHLPDPTPATQPALPTENLPTAAPESGCRGEAVGPNWIHRMALPGRSESTSERILEMDCQVAAIEELPTEQCHNLRVSLTNGRIYEVDLVIAAIGVDPSLPWVPAEIDRGQDGGLLVDTSMCTNIPHIYAAGDCCTVNWGIHQSPHWFQMRLWTQAKVMGQYAAQCIAGVAEGLDMRFELFTHVTRLLKQKVILLGQYTSTEGVSYQRAWETPHGPVYARVLLSDGCVQGAILIGETELEETMENLILDRLDVSHYGEQILNPDIDHIFD